MTNEEENGMLYDELHAVVKRYCSEGDNLTTYGVIGALEAVKADVLDMLARQSDRKRPSMDEESS